MCSACRKSPPAASFSEYLHCFPLGSMSLPGGKQCKETLLRKASESAAHVAGFGLHLEGYGPPNLPEGFFDSLARNAVARVPRNQPLILPKKTCAAHGK